MQECTPGMTFEEANDRDNEIRAGTGDCNVVSDVCLYSEKPETDVDFSPLGLCVMFRPSTAYDPSEDPHSTATPTSNSKGSVPPSPPFVRDYSTRGSQTKSQITSNAFAQLDSFPCIRVLSSHPQRRGAPYPMGPRRRSCHQPI